jgi:demethylmenaquinone methyltransferase/2-methoxy-6-polyprenyl-1,4-benzoquinol methylase
LCRGFFLVKTDLKRTSHRASLRDLDIERHLGDPRLRQSYVTPMFDLIAPRYDRFTRVFSLGMDRRWKAEVIELVRESVPAEGRLCDVACGTGDLAFAAITARPDLRVVATDVSTRMLALAASRASESGARIQVSAGDLSTLPLPAASVDAVTAGYALRNTPDWRHALGEVGRVLRPGGHLFTLDFFLPESRAWRAAFLGWLHVAGRTIGWLWHREPMAYGYIAHSIQHFTTMGEFAQALGDAGFEVRAVRQHLGGGIAVHHARKR